MKNLFFVFGFFLTSGRAQASDTPLVLQQQGNLELVGQAPQTTALDALVIYAPVGQTGLLLQCQFPEDRYSANGNEIARSFRTKPDAHGHYSLPISLHGRRRGCALSTVNFRRKNWDSVKRPQACPRESILRI